MTTTQNELDRATFRESIDAVLHVRVWGTGRRHVLPDPSCFELIGSSSECTIQLDDKFAAPRHALLTYSGEQWWVQDLGTPHGVRQDGVYRRHFALTPGVEIGIGGVTLIAESARNVRLRDFCQRLLGWDADRLHDVDHALRAIRLAEACRSPLILCGEGDLVPIAQSLHRYMRNKDAPFVVCDPRRRNTGATVRSPANLPSGVDAIFVALGGSLCVRYTRLPHNVEELVRHVCQPNADAQLLICMPSKRRSPILSGMQMIELPPLRIREVELSRIVHEYAQDAVDALGVAPMSLTEGDLEWVLMHSAKSLCDIEKGTMRLVALRASQSVSQAAARLGMAPVSLNRWVVRRVRLGSAERAPQSIRSHVLAFDTNRITRSRGNASPTRRSRSTVGAA